MNVIEFRKELTKSINKNGIDNEFGIPDFILANYVEECLRTLKSTMDQRKVWFSDDVQQGIVEQKSS